MQATPSPTGLIRQLELPGLILGLRLANERRCYFIMTSLIGWVPAWNQSWLQVSWYFKWVYNYTIVWFLRAPRWYMDPTAMPRAAVTPILAVTAARGIAGGTIYQRGALRNHTMAAVRIISAWAILLHIRTGKCKFMIMESSHRNASHITGHHG